MDRLRAWERGEMAEPSEGGADGMADLEKKKNAAQARQTELSEEQQSFQKRKAEREAAKQRLEVERMKRKQKAQAMANAAGSFSDSFGGSQQGGRLTGNRERRMMMTEGGKVGKA